MSLNPTATPTPTLTHTRRSSRTLITPIRTTNPVSPSIQRSTTRRSIPSSVKVRGTVIRLDDAVDGNISSPDPLALVSPSPISPLAENRDITAGTSHMGGENAIAGPSSATRTPRKRPTADGTSFKTPPTTRTRDPTSGLTIKQSQSHEAVMSKAPASGPEKRVLPARIRRAAGGGAEGIRDLEEMIVDWLERWGTPCTTPPDNLPIHMSTLPLSLIDPPTQVSSSSQPAPPLITLTPNQSSRLPTPSPRRSTLVLDKEERIETPSWIMVKPGEDDQEEAREEMDGRKVALSPVKRLRRLPGDEAHEDTSDAYYFNLHKKYEVFERRQRIREKEKLVFERYKMKSRIDLLRNMSSGAWSSIVAVVLSRSTHGDIWEKGKHQIESKGIDWLRDRLVKEGKELVKRYDQLLPVEPKKSRADRSFSTPTPTPPRQLSSLPSLSPPPVLPARVSALRDPASQKRSRATPDARTRATPARGQRKSSVAHDSPVSAGLPAPSPRKRRKNSSVKMEDGVDLVDQVADIDTIRRLSPSAQSSPISDGSPPHYSPSPEPFFPPITSSGLPCLIEAASRRESAHEEMVAAQAKVEAAASAKKDGKRVSRFIAREKTRTSGRLGVVQPFGLPIPPVVEYKSDFTLTDEEDFWGIIADREAHAVTQRRQSLVSALGGLSNGTATESSGSVGMAANVSREDVMDMREVEAAVVL